MTIAQEQAMQVDERSFKEALSHWATGVTIVSALADGRPVGITASSLTSLSLSPPQVLVSVSKRLYTHGAIRESGAFAVSILREEQMEWGMRFAGMIPEAEDRFAGIETITAATGSPILREALAWLDCRVRHVYDGEDHSIIVGEVLASAVNHGGAPLLYYDRHWRTLTNQPD